MRKVKQILFIMVVILVVCSTSTLWGQQGSPSAESEFTLEEITVTAEHREANVQKTSLSISVVSGDDLIREAISNVATLLDSVPGLDLTQASPYGNLSMRGQGAGGGVQYTDPVMTLNVGGVPQGRNYATTAAMYDVARIEVLKGPQGTLYGRNATVGAINVIPNLPKDEFEENAGVTIGNYSTLNTRGMINVPLSEKWASRVAFSTNHHEGYLTNGYNDKNDMAARASALYKPDDKLSLLLWADYYNNYSKGPSTIFRYVTPNQEFQVPDNPWFAWGPAGSCSNPAYCPAWGNGGNQFRPGGNLAPDAYGNDPLLESKSVVDDDGHLNIKQQIYAAELNYRFNDMTLTVIPAYLLTDVDFHSYQNALDYANRSSLKQMTFETRLASDYSTDFKWQVGMFYFNETVDAYLTNLEVGGYQILSTPNLDAKSLAVFGETTIPLMDKLRVTAGLRYTSDKKTQDGFTLLDAFTSFDFPPSLAQTPGVISVVTGPATIFNNYYPFGYCIVRNGGEMTDSDFSWKIGLESDISKNSLLYANVRTAYKAGGFDPGLPPNTYKPEKLKAYEIGSKNRFFNNSVQANLEIFYWDYKDQQISIMQQLHPAGQSGIPVNVPGYLYGAEISIDALITQYDLVKLGLVNTKGKYDVYPQVISSSGVIGGLTDYDRVNMPKWNATLSYDHTFDIGEKGQIVANASGHYESKTSMRPVLVNVPGDYRDAFVKLDATLTYTAPEQKWELSLFGKNLTNVAVVGSGTSGTVANGIFYKSPTNVANMRGSAIEAPRTFGVSISMNF